MKKIAIIGSESFLAKNYIHYLRNKSEDIHITCYDYISKKNEKNYIQIDFNSMESIRKIDFNVNCVFLFTGKTGTVNGFKEYASFISVNEIYLLNIITCMLEQKYNPRIIYPSSRLLFAESDSLVSENAKWNLKSIYAVTKASAENYLKIYSNNFGISYVILRICTPYGSLIDSAGSYGTFEIFYNQAEKSKRITIFGDGNQMKTYTQMEDVCEAFYRLMKAENIEYCSYHLGGQRLSLNDVAASIADKMAAEIVHTDWPDDYKNVDGGSVIFDSSRFDKEFDMHYHKVME